MERTRGMLFVDPVFSVAIYDAKRRRIADAMGLKTKEDDANAAHLVACWNAIEAAGGDPAIVAEALDALGKLAKAAGAAVSSDPDMPSRGVALDYFDAELDHAEVVLRRAGRVS